MKNQSPFFVIQVLFVICLVSLLMGVPLSAQGDKNLENQLREPIPPKTDETSLKIIRNVITRLGGESRLSALQNRMLKRNVIEGKDEYSQQIWEAPPNHLREDTLRKSMGKMEVVTEGFDGENAWIFDQTKKHPFPEELSDKQAEAHRMKNYFISPFIDYEARGLVFSYQGKVSSRKRECYLLKMHRPDGRTEYLYIDSKTFLLTRRGWQEIIGRAIVDKDEFMLKYGKYNDVLMPTHFEYAISGQVYGKTEITKIETNLPLEKGFFSLPKVKETWLKQNR